MCILPIVPVTVSILSLKAIIAKSIVLIGATYNVHRQFIFGCDILFDKKHVISLVQRTNAMLN